MTAELLQLAYILVPMAIGWMVRHKFGPAVPVPAVPALPSTPIQIPNLPAIAGNHPLLNQLETAFQEALNKALMDLAARLASPKA